MMRTSDITVSLQDLFCNPVLTECGLSLDSEDLSQMLWFHLAAVATPVDNHDDYHQLVVSSP